MSLDYGLGIMTATTFEQKYEKNIGICIWKVSVFGGEIINIFE